MTERSNQPHRQRPPDVEEALSSMLWTPYERTPTDSSSEDDVDRLDKQLSLQHRKRRKSQSGFEQRAAASYVAIDGSYFGIDDLCSVRTPIAPYHPTLPTAAAATTFQQQPIITTTTTPQPPFVPFPNLSLSRAATAGHNELLLPATISAASSDYHKHYESSVCYNRSSYPSYGPIPSLTKWWSSGATASSSIKEPPSYESLYTKKGNSSTDTMRPMLDSLKAGGLHSVNIEQHEAENSCDRSNRSPTVLNTTTTITTTDNVPSERLVHSFTDDFISLNCTSSATLATSTTMFQQQTAMQHVPTNVDKPHAVERDRKCNKVNENAKINETGQEEKREETATNVRSQQKIENINNNNNNNSEHVSCIMNEHKNNHHCCASNNNDECNSEVKEPTTTTIEERATEETETNSLVVQVNQPVYCATPIREHCVTTTTTTATATTTTATLNPIMNTPTNSPTISTTVAAANMARSCDKSTLTDNSSVNFQQSNAEPLLLTEEHMCNKSGWSTVESERASERAIIRADSFKAYTSARKRSSATSSFYRGDRQTNFYTSDNLTPNKCLAELERLYAEFRASESIYERKLKAQSEIGAGTVAVADVQTATMRLNIPASFADAAASSVVVATTAAPATTCSSVFLGATTTATNVHSSSGSSNSNNNNNNCNNNNDNDNNTVENGLSSARSVSNISILPATKSCQRQASLTIQVNNSNDNDNNNNNNNNNNHVGNNGRSVSIAMPTTNQIAINQQQQQQKQLTSTTVHNSNNNSNENISVVNCNYVQANNINSNGNSNLKNNPYKSNRLTEKATSVVEVSAATVAPSLVDGVHIINTHVSSPVPKVLKASSVENDNVRVANAFSENHNSNNNNTTTTTTTSDTSACAESVNIINVNTITTNHITTATTTAPSTAATTTSTSAITAVTPSHMSQVPTRTFTSIECQTDDIATTSTQLRSGAGGGDGGGSGGGTGAGGSTGVSGSSISNNAANREQRRRERRERRQQQQHQQQQQALTNPIGPSARRHPSDRHSLHAPTHPTALSHLHPPLHHHHLSTGAIMRPMLPDILHHSHYPPPYSALPGSGIHPTLPAPPSLLGPPSGPPPPPQAPHPPVAPPGATLLAPVVATCALPGTAALLADGRFSLPLPIMRRSPSERSGKGCCGQWFAGPPLRALIAVVAFGGFACALGGVALGATGLAGPPASHLTAALLMIGVGVVLVTVSGAAWRMTAPGGQTCLGLGSSVDLGRCGRRPCSRGGGTPHGLLYPEFQHRPPPPSYQASMQEYRLRLLLLDRDRQNGVVRGNSPPPTYRSHAGSLLRAPLTTLRGSSIGGSEYSLPPSYRSRHGTPSTVCSERTIETAPSGRLLANEDIPEPSGAEQLLPDYCSLQANTLLTSAIVEIETSNHNRNDSESATECQRAMTTTATTASKTNATNIKDNSQTAKAKDLVTIVTISQSNVDATNGARMNSTTTDQIDILAHL